MEIRSVLLVPFTCSLAQPFSEKFYRVPKIALFTDNFRVILGAVCDWTLQVGNSSGFIPKSSTKSSFLFLQSNFVSYHFLLKELNRNNKLSD